MLVCPLYLPCAFLLTFGPVRQRMAILAESSGAGVASADDDLAIKHMQEHTYEGYKGMISELEEDLEDLRRLHTIGEKALRLGETFIARVENGEIDSHYVYPAYLVAA